MEDKQLIMNLLEARLTIQVQENLLEISNYCTDNAEEVAKAFKESFKNLFDKVVSLQTQGYKREIGYLTISVLRTFSMDKNYKLRLELYDKSFFLDKIECCEYLDIGFIMKYIDKDIELLLNELKDIGMKYKEYEIDELKKNYIGTYIDVIHEFLTNNLTNIFEVPEYDKLHKSSDFKIIFGEYLDKTVTLFDRALEKGGE